MLYKIQPIGPARRLATRQVGYDKKGNQLCSGTNCNNTHNHSHSSIAPHEFNFILGTTTDEFNVIARTQMKSMQHFTTPSLWLPFESAKKLITNGQKHWKQVFRAFLNIPANYSGWDITHIINHDTIDILVFSANLTTASERVSCNTTQSAGTQNWRWANFTAASE